jgi:hypothetical protein
MRGGRGPAKLWRSRISGLTGEKLTNRLSVPSFGLSGNGATRSAVVTASTRVPPSCTIALPDEPGGNVINTSRVSLAERPSRRRPPPEPPSSLEEAASNALRMKACSLSDRGASRYAAMTRTNRSRSAAERERASVCDVCAKQTSNSDMQCCEFPLVHFQPALLWLWTSGTGSSAVAVRCACEPPVPARNARVLDW